MLSLPLQCFWSQAIPRGMVELAVSAWFPREMKHMQSRNLCLFIHLQWLGSPPAPSPKTNIGSRSSWSDSVAIGGPSLQLTAWEEPTQKAGVRAHLLLDTSKHTQYRKLPQIPSPTGVWGECVISRATEDMAQEADLGQQDSSCCFLLPFFWHWDSLCTKHRG